MLKDLVSNLTQFNACRSPSDRDKAAVLVAAHKIPVGECSLLRDALKVELQCGQMKLVKPFARSWYSEATLKLSSPNTSSNEREYGSLISEQKTILSLENRRTPVV
jgi:hypothetical protein